MILQVGNTYVTRSNQIVRITNTQKVGTVTLFRGNNNQAYWVHGTHYAGDPSFDLVAEKFKDHEHVFIDVYNPPKESKMNLEVGGIYLTEDTEVVEITHKSTFDGKPCFVGNNDNRYYPDGTHCMKPGIMDLIEVKKQKPKAKSEYIGCNYHQLHPDFIRRVAKIHAEGEKKYGYQNATLGLTDQRWIDDRFDHAMDHLLRYREGDRTEDHLAKVGWFLDLMMKVEAAKNEQS